MSEMSEIIPFPLHRVRPVSVMPGSVSAKVIIFSGVRIERLGQPARKPPARRRRRVAGSKFEQDHG